MSEHLRMPSESGCRCAYCVDRRPVDIPEELIAGLASGSVVVFAGAGISTESRLAYPRTLYEEMLEAVPQLGTDESFSTVASAYCDRYGRREFLLLVKSRFQRIDSFPELWGMATRFHLSIAPVSQVDTIITTNWDEYFERYCGALPLVTAEDLPFWDLPSRKVLKIHGSMANVGTIVATERDYSKCYRRLRDGSLGAAMRHLLSTKSVLFVGYSLRDPHFLRLYKYMRREIGNLLPRSYLVTIDPAADASALGVRASLLTDATHLIELVKDTLVRLGLMLPEARRDTVSDDHERIRSSHREVHERISFQENPSAIYSTSYQDGLMHALGRALALWNTGYYSSPENLTGAIQEYSNRSREAKRARAYWDAAYADGYIAGLERILYNQPLREWYVLGSTTPIDSFDAFAEELRRAELLQPHAYERAVATVADAPEGRELYHPPHFGV